ncbi:hypothetical protein [Roseomonas genomospecies 6]|uniref:hypothetical protein n=1 Tax=Roseomonas genomospecies 6 TaxID=214106 RepID=UPI0011F34B53|nr:hypothetical protein [Roseomonas genomospecies 6]
MSDDSSRSRNSRSSVDHHEKKRTFVLRGAAVMLLRRLDRRRTANAKSVPTPIIVEPLRLPEPECSFCQGNGFEYTPLHGGNGHLGWFVTACRCQEHRH